MNTDTIVQEKVFHPLIALCRVHQGDPLSTVIKEDTRTDYTHAMIIVGFDQVTGEWIVSEAYVPHVRRRRLAASELAGIDVFSVEMNDEQAQGIQAYCLNAEAVKEPYSIENLCRFSPIFRAILGESKDINVHSPVICSQYDFDAFDRGGGIKLLNAPSYKISPGVLAWSTLLKPEPMLLPPPYQSPVNNS